MKNLGYKLLVVISLLLVSCAKPENPSLTIATASNMQFAIAEIAKEFTKETGIPCKLVISSSGKLTAQIKEGAPYDIFVAANMKYPQEIVASNLALTKPQVYAYGKLVLWSLGQNKKLTLQSLSAKEIKHIAIANPKTAPYGRAAVEALTHLSLYTPLEKKLVFGESISQTNQFILSGAADIGFTAKAIVLSPRMKGVGQWIPIDSKAYSPIEQGIVVLKKDISKNDEALQFNNFIFSQKSRAILINYGYAVDE